MRRKQKAQHYEAQEENKQQQHKKRTNRKHECIGRYRQYLCKQFYTGYLSFENICAILDLFCD